MYFGTILTFAFLSLVTVVDSRPSKQMTKPYIRGCYYTNWSQYRPEPWKFVPENYQPGLCTHLFYAFVVMNNDYTLKAFEWNDEDKDGTAGMYTRVNALKQQQPDLKTLLSFGGYVFSEGHAPQMRSMVTNAKNRQTFIKSVVSFVRRTGFDGFDFDWEYPDWGTKNAYTTLIREMREAFDSEANSTGRPRLLLTAAVAAGIDRISAGYNGRALVNYFDFLNVMTYDFHGAWENKVGFCAPLFDRNNDRLSVISAMTYWSTNQGFPKDKLVVGMAAYGRGWSVAGPTAPEIGSAANGPALPETFTREKGVASYYEICDMIEKRMFVSQFDSVQRVPYVFKNGAWFGYDDVKSFNEKLDWIVDNGYAGAFVWSLDMDDFLGRCGSSGGGKYPLISAIRTKLESDAESAATKASTSPAPSTAAVSPMSTSAPTITTPSPTTSRAGTPTDSTTIVSEARTETPSVAAVPSTPAGPFQCPEGGLYPDPSSCTSFIQCDDSGNAYKLNCPAGLHFNKETLVCDWPNSAGCDKTKSKVDPE